MGRATVALPQVTPAPAAGGGGSVYRAAPEPPAPANPPPANPPPAISPPPNPLPTAPLPGHPPEDTGSLTGAVLRRGLPAEGGSSSRTGYVVLTIVGAVLMLVAFGFIVVALTGDAVGSFFDALLG